MLPADRVRLLLERHWQFARAATEWLHVADQPITHTPAILRNLQPFDGIPEVYPAAMALLDVVGPGTRMDVDWLPEGWGTNLKVRVKDVARLARHLIVEEWGWPQGYEQDHLRALVAHRRATGRPTLRKFLSENRASYEEDVPPEDRFRHENGLPQFREQIPPAKKEQFDRIVTEFDQGCAIFYDIPWTDPALASTTRADATNQFKWALYEYHMDDLDGAERNFLGEREYTAEKLAEKEAMHEEEEEYRLRPLIGKRAAILKFKDIEFLVDFERYLRFAIEDEFGISLDPDNDEFGGGDDETSLPRSNIPDVVQNATFHPNPQSSPSRLTPIDSMKKDEPRWGVPIALLDYMESRDRAPYDDIALHVHGDKETKEGTIRQNVSKVNAYLESKGYTFKFGCGSGYVTKAGDS